MVTLINTSGGNLHLDSFGLVMAKGDRLPYDGELHELLVKAPEIVLFIERARVIVLEDEQNDLGEPSDEHS